MSQSINRDPVVRGVKYAQGFQASVAGILGADTPRVISRGSQFVHHNRWTGRALITAMCRWAGEHPGCVPTVAEVTRWVTDVNNLVASRPEIIVAAMAEEVPLRVALGMTGGAYHEAFHGRYSCKRPLTVDEAAQIILPRWAKVKDWSQYHGLLQTWNNVVEDVRIERLGRVEYPGSLVKLHDLQDFILGQESEGRNHVRAHGGDATQGALSVILCTFRDVGLGYNTLRQQEALEGYRKSSSDAVEMVLSGPLSPMLRESINLSAQDDLGCIRLAFDIVAKLVELSRADQSGEQSQPGQRGDGKQACPKCKAPASALVVRPKADVHTGVVPGKGICTCTKCGYQEEIDLMPSSDNAPSTGDSSGPRFQDFDQDGEDGEEQAPGASGESDEDGDETEGSSEDGEGSEDGEDGEGTEGEDAEGEDAEGSSEGEGESSSERKGDGKSGEARPSKGAGGHSHDKDPVKGNKFEDLIKEALKAPDNTGMLDNNSALESAINGVREAADKDLKQGEAAWRPYDQSLDDILIVKPSQMGKDHDNRQVTKLLTSVKEESSFLRARLRNIVRAMEMTDTVHGLPKGRRLSQRFLVDSRISLMSGDMPKRAYKVTDEQQDVSMAAFVSLDQSGSMTTILPDATRMLCALVEPLEAIGAKVMAAGWRNGKYGSGRPASEYGKGYHRDNGIVHDVFKTFDERFTSVKGRFANTRGTGGTPMADGVQFGLDNLSSRKEAHRFLFILTDGDPDSGHAEIIRRQQRLAEEAGIHVIGIGIGAGATGVQTLFKHYLYSDDVKQIPKLLVAKLNDLVDGRVVKRGVRMKSTG
jgi:hypothetical protein